ncbi:ComF family protein [Catellatospora tritici]|uniref:ComF family protein n=1 Tax=Catellatospora tritici TaxID=2851566 RepID=UPI0027E15B0E|nr:phosphoribosyltransferase family protein [Catellatospora tritici]
MPPGVRRARAGAAATALWGALSDLVLPAACAGCGQEGLPLRFEVCEGCARELEGLRARPTRPQPAPDGLPECVTLGDYDGRLRELLLAYKERGRHRLARPLGALLAEAVAAVVPSSPVLLLHVPDTAAAARARHGDHMLLLSRGTAARLREAGRRVGVAQPLRALPKADSTQLSSAQRALAALGGFTTAPGQLAAARRAAAGSVVVLLDDIITTGATLSAAAACLANAGVRVDACVTLAATRRTRA